MHIYTYFRLKCPLTSQERGTINRSLVSELILAVNILHLCFTEIFYHLYLSAIIIGKLLNDGLW